MRVQAREHVVLYCQTASTTTSGASRGMFRKTSMPCFWLSMKPCPFAASKGCPRRTSRPSRRMASMTASSTRACAGQHTWFAESRRSPLATTITVSGMFHILTCRPAPRDTMNP